MLKMSANMKIELDNIASLKKQTQHFLNVLKFGKPNEIERVRNTLSQYSALLTTIDDLLESLKSRKAIWAEYRLALAKFRTILYDTLLFIENRELTNDLRVQQLRLLNAAYDNFCNLFDSFIELKSQGKLKEGEEEENSYELFNKSNEYLFAKSAKDAKLDEQALRSKHKKKSLKSKKVKRHIILSCSPGITDEIALSAGITFRILSGYALIPDQRILAMNKAKIEDPYEYAIGIANKYGLSMASELSYNGRVIYAWMMPNKTREALFKYAEINAWCCVNPKQG